MKAGRLQKGLSGGHWPEPAEASLLLEPSHAAVAKLPAESQAGLPHLGLQVTRQVFIRGTRHQEPAEGTVRTE